MNSLYVLLEDAAEKVSQTPFFHQDLCQSPATYFVLSALVPATYLRLKKSVEDLSRKHNNADVRKKRSLLHEKFNVSKVPADLDYVIIGSGMAGLSCAAILARLGRKVVVLEQHHDTAGGGTHMFDLKGFSFDSGLHYTVPWSVPLLALTCLKKPKDCVPFDMMLEEDGTIDKIFLVENSSPKKANSSTSSSSKDLFHPFRIQYHEPHLQRIYEAFPQERAAIDKYLSLSDQAMVFVKYFLFARLLPKSLQRWFWSLFVPNSVLAVAATTAKELLPSFIKNKKLISLFSSMWIDTGARPDEATFALTASVFRGIPMEGGCYPRGGSVELAKELITVIEVRKQINSFSSLLLLLIFLFLFLLLFIIFSFFL
jgi:all-trans-retinol 13,14-reductase